MWHFDVFDRSVVCGDGAGNQQAVSASTASSSQNSLTGGVAVNSSQNSLKGSALLVLLRTQRPAVVEVRSW